MGDLAGRVGPHQAEKGHAQPLVAVVEQALVEERQQRVQDGRVRLEDLVNEGHLAGGQIAINLPDILIVLQACSTTKVKATVCQSSQALLQSPALAGWTPLRQ